jgi:hypothetical protein
MQPKEQQHLLRGAENDGAEVSCDVLPIEIETLVVRPRHHFAFAQNLTYSRTAVWVPPKSASTSKP